MIPQNPPSVLNYCYGTRHTFLIKNLVRKLDSCAVFNLLILSYNYNYHILELLVKILFL